MSRAVAVLCLLLLACESSTTIKARGLYNDGVESLAAGNLEEAQEKLERSIGESGLDPELRYRAALNLGLTYARQADAKGADAAEEALSLLQQSAYWFRDASRLRKLEARPRQNLQVVTRRIRVLVDQLDKFKGLKARLDKVIEQQRGLYDEVRNLVTAMDEAKAADATGFENAFSKLAITERMLLAEIRAVGDIGGDEAQNLEDKAEDQRTPEESSRIIQLGNLDHYLGKAAASIADTRRELRGLAGKRSLSTAGVALEELKRAREQLLDPVAVLRSLTQEEQVLIQHTNALAASKKLTAQEASGPLPGWLTAEYLADRQAAITPRLSELVERFRAAANAEVPADADAKTKRSLEMAKLAVPELEQAKTEMEAAHSELATSATKNALKHEQTALLAMFRALELFADIKRVVEMAHGSQSNIVGLLDPTNAKTLNTKELARRLAELVQRNQGRLTRLEGLIQDEVASLAAQKANAGGQAPTGQGQTEPTPEQLEQQQQLYQQAETLRVQAEVQLGELAGIVNKTAKGDAKLLATDGLNTLAELRSLFFNVIEHLEDLIAQQQETRDQTSVAQALPDDKRLTRFGPLVSGQQRHTATGEAIAKALAELADQAAKNPQPSQSGAPPPPKFAEAAEEVRSANPHLSSATDGLSNAQKDAASMSVSLEPVMTEQDKALEFLRSALELLKPKKDDGKQKKDQDEENKQEDASKQQQEQRLQEAREREAERRRGQKQQQDESVEKDW